MATGRDPQRVREALGEHGDLVRRRAGHHQQTAADAAVQAAVDRFGRIDVLVNNAATFYAGYFEELTPEHFRTQLDTNFFGPANVTRAVLPVQATTPYADEFPARRGSTSSMTGGHDVQG